MKKYEVIAQRGDGEQLLIAVAGATSDLDVGRIMEVGDGFATVSRALKVGQILKQGYWEEYVGEKDPAKLTDDFEELLREADVADERTSA